jgi:hypothetical protein
MRCSAKAFLKALRININPDVEDYIAFIGTEHDHSLQSTITFSGTIFNEMSKPTTQAEFDHLVLWLISTTMHQFGLIWLKSVSFLLVFSSTDISVALRS